MSEAAMLEVSGLRTEFQTARGVVHAVNDVSFSVTSGQLVGIVGETGCGKSVTARSVLGMVRAPGRIVAGSVKFEGRELRGLSPKAMRQLRGAGLSFVPQTPWGALNPVLSIERQFRFAIRAHRKASRAECRQLAIDLLRTVGISGPERVLDGHAHELSGGMAQRVVLALALVLDPRLLIADEPTTALDVTVQRQILDLIRELILREGRSMLLVTHDLGVVAQYCSEVLVMYAGKIVERGSVASVFRDPRHPYTAALLAAIPRAGHQLQTLPGTVPDLVDYPSGCPFRARCPHAMPVCADTEPVLRDVASRDIACHLLEGVIEHVARAS